MIYNKIINLTDVFPVLVSSDIQLHYFNYSGDFEIRYTTFKKKIQ